MRDLLDALRHSLRRLRKAPTFTLVTLLTLGLGLGANTAIFSIVRGVLLKPLPYPDSERLVSIWLTAPGVKIDDLNMAPYLYLTFRDEARAFDSVALWSPDSYSVTGIGEPEEVAALDATHELLPLLGVQPMVGRRFEAKDNDPKSARTVMLTAAYWRSRFGGQASAIGRRILLEGEAYEVIGVTPDNFTFMDRRFSLIVPYRPNPAEVKLGGFGARGLARLKPGETIASANADVARMLAIGLERFPAPTGFGKQLFIDARVGPKLRTMKDDLLGDISKTLWILMGTVGLVLAIACANVANLLLVRAEGRQHELTIRAALGAGWGAIARELLAESVILGLSGGVLGLLLAEGALRILIASKLQNFPRMGEISLDGVVVALALAASVLAGLAFGLIPVLKHMRPRLASALRGGGRSMSQSRERHRTKSLLVVAQVAMALVLLVGAALMIRTFRALQDVDPGFEQARGVQTLRLSIPAKQVESQERVIRMQEEILRKIEGLPQVEAAAFASSAPMGNESNDPVHFEDQPLAEGKIPPVRRFKFISPGYLRAVGSRLIAGREIDWNDTYRAAAVAMVSENLAREIWKEPALAVGKRIRVGTTDDWREVVGVVADLRDNGIDRPAPTIVYWPLWLRNFEGSPERVTRGVSYFVRSPRAGTARFREELQQAVWSVNANLPMTSIQTFQEIRDRSLARTAFTMALLGVAGGMALILGVVGIYGVISYSVAQRTREIGIRLALGSPASRVAGLFLRHGLVLSSAGVVIGLAAALALSRAMQSLLFEIDPLDPYSYAAVALGLIAAAVLASYLPARAAAKVDPLRALAAE